MIVALCLQIALLSDRVHNLEKDMTNNQDNVQEIHDLLLKINKRKPHIGVSLETTR